MAPQDSGIKTAFFVIADISGYTKFMAETPIEHAKGILEALLGSWSQQSGRRLRSQACKVMRSLPMPLKAM
jgi:hypothetical protein